VTAPIPGVVTELRVSPGQEVKTGQVLLILEAMKMQNEIPSPRDGVVKEIPVARGASVNTGDVLVVIG
jgi:pyruvate carboxylase subunit B